MFDFHSIGWRYWLATLILLACGLAGWRPGLDLATALCAVQVVHFALRERGMSAFPVQVRLGYLALLVAGRFEPLEFIHWVQLIGTTAMVVFGYCPLARAMSLLPWNRREPLTLDLLRRVFFSSPVRGSILQRLSAEPASVTA